MQMQPAQADAGTDRHQPYFEAAFLGGPGLVRGIPVVRRVRYVRNERHEWTVPDSVASSQLGAAQGRFILDEQQTRHGRLGYVWQPNESESVPLNLP